jgi:hypothetical protein
MVYFDKVYYWSYVQVTGYSYGVVQTKRPMYCGHFVTYFTSRLSSNHSRFNHQNYLANTTRDT